MLELIVPFGVDLGYIDVKSAKSSVPVAGEIEVSIWPKGGKFLVAFGVNGGS